ncbi:serine/threonine protein kinase [Thalassoglobus neptunius]|nr:serine/threonine-protein kinase [Thalassoglobus neptunius]
MRCLGRGGMGIVFRVFDPQLNRDSAVKVLSPELAGSAAARQRFSREAKSAAAVVHPHVVPIQTVDEHDGLPYLVMPVVEGQSLQQRVEKDGPLSVIETVRIASQVAEGLAAAHEQGLVHRDIKPANILLENGVERVQLTDFGLARAVDDASMTRSGVIAGTPQYMSPEQAHGDSVDHRSDLFSLGSVVYFMLTGRSPFRAETTMGVLNRISNDEPRSLRSINPDVPEWLETVVVKLLEKDRDQRFQSAEEVAKLLEDCLAHIQQPTEIDLPATLIGAPLTGESGSPPQRGISHEGTKSSLSGWIKQRFHRQPPTRKLLIALGFAAPLLLAGIVFLIESSKGTIRIECDADELPLVIKKDGKVYDKLTVGRDGESIRVYAGEYEVTFAERFDQFAIDNGTVELLRGKETVVRIREKVSQLPLPRPDDGVYKSSENDTAKVHTPPPILQGEPTNPLDEGEDPFESESTPLPGVHSQSDPMLDNPPETSAASRRLPEVDTRTTVKNPKASEANAVVPQLEASQASQDDRGRLPTLLEQLQGTWRATRLVENGHLQPIDARFTLKVSGEHCWFKVKEGYDSGTITMTNYPPNSKLWKCQFVTADNVTKTPAIIRFLSQDKLEICLNESGSTTYPSTFESTPDSFSILATLVREDRMNKPIDPVDEGEDPFGSESTPLPGFHSQSDPMLDNPTETSAASRRPSEVETPTTVKNPKVSEANAFASLLGTWTLAEKKSNPYRKGEFKSTNGFRKYEMTFTTNQEGPENTVRIVHETNGDTRVKTDTTHRVTLDPNGSPKQINIFGENFLMQGVFDLIHMSVNREDDILQIAWNGKPDVTRPSSVEATPDSDPSHTLWILKRAGTADSKVLTAEEAIAQGKELSGKEITIRFRVQSIRRRTRVGADGKETKHWELGSRPYRGGADTEKISIVLGYAASARTNERNLSDRFMGSVIEVKSKLKSIIVDVLFTTLTPREDIILYYLDVDDIDEINVVEPPKNNGADIDGEALAPPGFLPESDPMLDNPTETSAASRRPSKVETPTTEKNPRVSETNAFASLLGTWTLVEKKSNPYRKGEFKSTNGFRKYEMTFTTNQEGPENTVRIVHETKGDTRVKTDTTHRVTLDPNSTPKQINIFGENFLIQGVFDLIHMSVDREDDILQIAWNGKPDVTRPSSVEATPDSDPSHTLWILKRAGTADSNVLTAEEAIAQGKELSGKEIAVRFRVQSIRRGTRVGADGKITKHWELGSRPYRGGADTEKISIVLGYAASASTNERNLSDRFMGSVIEVKSKLKSIIVDVPITTLTPREDIILYYFDVDDINEINVVEPPKNKGTDIDGEALAPVEDDDEPMDQWKQNDETGRPLTDNREGSVLFFPPNPGTVLESEISLIDDDFQGDVVFKTNVPNLRRGRHSNFDSMIMLELRAYPESSSCCKSVFERSLVG